MKKFLLIFSFLFVTLSTACSATKPEQKQEANSLVDKGRVIHPEEAKKAFAAGNLQLNRKNWEGALSRYKESSELDPEPWETYMNAAIAEIMKAESLKAIDLMKQCFAHGGDKHQEAFYNLGNIYQERGLYYEAVQAYRAALAAGDSNDFDTLTNLAAAYLFMGDSDSAEATYQYLEKLRPDSPIPKHGLGMVLFAREDLAGALKLYEEVNARMPDFAPAFFNKGEILVMMERTQPAIEAFKNYLLLAPDGPYAKRAEQRIQRLEQ